LRFHDLRHTFGTRMIAKADIVRVKEWMGHADVQTTMRYLHYVPRPDDARLVDEAFALDEPAEPRAHADRAPASAGRIEGTRRLAVADVGQPGFDVAAVEAPVAADDDRRKPAVSPAGVLVTPMSAVRRAAARPGRQ
jgi:hypothetical protein